MLLTGLEVTILVKRLVWNSSSFNIPDDTPLRLQAVQDIHGFHTKHQNYHSFVTGLAMFQCFCALILNVVFVAPSKRLFTTLYC